MIVVVFATCAPAGARQVTFDEQIVYPPQPWSQTTFGAQIAIGDINGDGEIDLVSAYPHLDNGRGGGYAHFGPNFTQAAKITHSTMKPVTGNYGGDRWGAGVWRIADVNSDGFDDVLVGASQADGLLAGQSHIGRAMVLFGPGLTQALELMPPNPSISNQTFASTGDVGDVTGDGIVDIVLGSPWYATHAAPGRYSVYDGAAGFAGPSLDLTPTPGALVASAWGQTTLIEDFDGNGSDDLFVTQGVLLPILSTASFLPNGLTQPTVYFPWSTLTTAGIDPIELRSMFEDVNGDGFRDLLSFTRCNAGGVSKSGRLLIQFGPAYSSFVILKGSAQKTYDGFAQSFDLGDVNRDGFVDIAVGQPALDIPSTPGGDFEVGRMTIFFGPAFTQTMEFDGSYNGVKFGQGVALADTDSDGFAEVFCSEQTWGPGRVHIYRHRTLRLTGATEVPLNAGATVPLSIEVGALSANAPYLVLMSASGSAPGIDVPYAGSAVHVPIVFDAFTSAAIGFVNTPLCANFLGTLNGNGNATATLTIPGGAISPVFAGLTITCATVVGDAQGNIAYATNSVAIPLVP